MTVQEFDAQKATLACSKCGHVGLIYEEILNNNALRVTCPACLSKHPLGLLMNLTHGKHASKTRRQEYPLEQGLYEVWERYGRRCVVCTRTEAELFEMGVGISRHHITESFQATGHDCPIVPVCNGCKSIVDARQRESLRWYRRLQELRAQPVSSVSPTVPRPGVSPDSVRPSRETPARGLEGLSDDHAHG